MLIRDAADALREKGESVDLPKHFGFLMNWQVRDSLDGRYFGPLPASSVIGRATPLYTDEDGDDRFVWRAPTR